MSTSNPNMYNGKFISNMSHEAIALIDSIKQSEVVEPLKKMIFNFPNDLVIQSVREQKRIRDIVKEEGINWEKYVGELREYQTLMTAFMYTSPRSINGDYVGLGKTAEVAALINLLKQKGELTRFCMAVESTALLQTALEMVKFTGLNIVAFPGETAKLKKLLANTKWDKVDGIIVKHSVLKNDTFLIFVAKHLSATGTNNLFNTLIVDESSIIKNKETMICEGISQLLKITPRCHMLNATPFGKSLMDVYNQLDILDINLMPPKTRIESKYSVYKKSVYWKTVSGKPKAFDKRERVGYQRQDEFKESLRYVYWGRSKKDVGKNLPHVYRAFEVEPTKDQLASIGNGYRYQEVLNCPSLIPQLGIPNGRKTVPKMDRVCKIVEEQYQESKVMIYCWNKEAQRTLAEELEKIGRKPAIIDGDTNNADVWLIQGEFNKSFEDGGYDVLITNARRSLNLQGADVCIFYSIEATSEIYTQIAGRIDRSVDDKVRDFILLVYKNTPEYVYLTGKVKDRAKDSRDLVLDAKGAIDYLLEDLLKEKETV